MKVFLAATSLLPSYGGPAFSVARLASALNDAGAQVGLWSADNSSAAESLLPSASRIQQLNGTEIEALNSFGQPDVLHDNGIWLPHNHRLAALSRNHSIPRVVSLRGMLEPWALRHKWFKKKIAWMAYQRRDLEQASCHLTSSEPEARNLEKIGLGVPVITVPNGVDLPADALARHANSEQPAKNGTRTALFLGRIAPVKGLPMLIEAWGRIRPQGWVLRIAGPDEGDYQREVEKAVSSADLEQFVSFLGPIPPEDKQALFRGADLFVLPTHSESFGVAVAEALAHGLPVLTTTGAPWSILPEQGCGWWVDANVDGLVHGLQQATDLDCRTLQAMGARGRAMVIERFSWERIAGDVLSAYRSILATTSLTAGVNALAG